MKKYSEFETSVGYQVRLCFPKQNNSHAVKKRHMLLRLFVKDQSSQIPCVLLLTAAITFHPAYGTLINGSHQHQARSSTRERLQLLKGSDDHQHSLAIEYSVIQVCIQFKEEYNATSHFIETTVCYKHSIYVCINIVSMKPKIKIIRCTLLLWSGTSL